MKSYTVRTLCISTALALSARVFAQTTDSPIIGQLRQIRAIPIGGDASAIPVAGEVAQITGKPYCATARTVENSPDGKHIDRSESNRVCRDEQGRTRREINGGKIVAIADPVAGLAYNLQTETRTATRRSTARAQPVIANPPLNVGPISMKVSNQSVKTLYETVAKVGGLNLLWDPEITAPVRNQFTVDLKSATLEQVLDTIAAMTGSYWRMLNATTIFVTDDTPSKRAAATNVQPAALPSLIEAAREQAKRISGGGRGGSGNAPSVTVDDLGTQVVNGITAKGVRTTSTIPTGTVGNDHDLKTVTERWVSEDLHVLVKSVYSDSRSGSTVYDLVDISQTSPDPSLFQVPSGYALQESGRGGRGGAAPVPQVGR